MDRMRKIADCLHEYLLGDYLVALRVLCQNAPSIQPSRSARLKVTPSLLVPSALSGISFRKKFTTSWCFPQAVCITGGYVFKGFV